MSVTREAVLEALGRITDPRSAEPQGPQKIPGIERIVAIASGKGGVGKSTVSSNLAVALAAEGRRVGLPDADVFGPGRPRMLGISGRPASPDGKIILPLRMDIRLARDGGAPVVASASETAPAQAFRRLARDLIKAGNA